MSLKKIIVVVILTLPCCRFSGAQTGKQSVPAQQKNWIAFNREATFVNDEIRLNARDNDGILWINDATFADGTIELDIKGKDVQGQSFVGFAFHGKDNTTFDAVYFRPFNFRSPERKAHAVQYISMPDHDWAALRKAFPGKYENTVDPIPDPSGWFHARIVVAYPQVKIFIDGSAVASLETTQLSNRKEGKLGLWVGNGSDGSFRNITVERTRP
jgi:hypothetical protein